MDDTKYFPLSPVLCWGARRGVKANLTVGVSESGIRDRRIVRKAEGGVVGGLVCVEGGELK